MAKSWQNDPNDAIHPDAPQGGGGPGFFRRPGPLGCGPDPGHRRPGPLGCGPDTKSNPKPTDAGTHTQFEPNSPERSKDDFDTMARMELPTHGLNDNVKKRAQDLVGKGVVGSGECYDLADKVLTEAGAKSAPAFGKITDDADYKWGTPVELAHVRSGDILQFRNYEAEIKTTFEDETYETVTEEHPHHTAVVLADNGDGSLNIAEQNVRDPDTDTGATSKTVRQNKLYIKSGSATTGKTKVQIKVSGTIMAYRPLPK